jgi:hypothetical protein
MASLKNCHICEIFIDICRYYDIIKWLFENINKPKVGFVPSVSLTVVLRRRR